MSIIWALSSRFSTAPVLSMSRSARVLLPWSMWATMQKLRIRCCDMARNIVGGEADRTRPRYVPRVPTAAASRRRIHWAMLAVVLIWGTNFAVTKVAIAQFPPLAFTAIRFAAGSLLMWLILERIEGRVRLPAGALPKLVALGVVGNTVYQLCFITGLGRTSATNSALLLSSMPTVVAVLGAALGVERVSRRVAAGIAVATAGVVLVLLARGAHFDRATLVGDLLMIVAVVAWAVYTVGLRRYALPLSPLRVTALTMITGTPGLVLAGIPELLSTDYGTIGVAGWGGLAYATLLSLVVAYLLWNASVGAVGPSRTAVYTCLTPLVAAAVAALLLGERPGPPQIAGALLIVGGVLLARAGPAPATT